MAKIIFSGIAGGEMRNKIAGSVFSKNRYGSYVRSKVTPVNPQTDSQQLARNRLSTFSQAWRGLTEEQRAGWNDATVNFPFTDIYGNIKFLSGQALYVKLNTNLAITGTAAINDAPAPIALPALESLTIAVGTTPTTVTVGFGPTPVPDDVALIIRSTGNVSPGITFIKNQLRFVQALPTADATPTDIATAWVSVFGEAVPYQKVTIQGFFISTITGQAGIPLQASTIVLD